MVQSVMHVYYLSDMVQSVWGSGASARIGSRCCAASAGGTVAIAAVTRLIYLADLGGTSLRRSLELRGRLALGRGLGVGRGGERGRLRVADRQPPPPVVGAA